MKPSEALALHREGIRAIVLANRACNPRVFGSVARGEDTEASDLDLLVDTLPETSLLDVGCIWQEVHELLGVPVDVLTPGALSGAFLADVLRDAVPV
jgi:predicted nucleotidyltransferase